MATLYLHIGLPKTGSTTIQNFMWDNREVLEQHGICHPDFGYRYDNVNFRRNGHFLFAPYVDAEGNRNFKIQAEEYKICLDKLGELGKVYDRIFLTDEGIWWGSHTRKDFWEQLKKDLDQRDLQPRIIVYIRRQDLWIQSYWAQNVKDGKTNLPFHEYLGFMEKRKYPLDFYAYMNKLAAIYGKDSLVIRVLERGQFRGKEHTLQSDFLEIFGLSLSDGFVVKQDVYNTKFGGNYLEIKRILNYLPDFCENTHPFVRNMKALHELNLLNYDYGKYSYFRPEEQKKFCQIYAESNQKLAQEYLGREDGVLFYEKVAELPELVVDDGQMMRDAFLLYGQMMNYLLQKNQALNEKIRNQSQQIKELRALNKETRAMVRDLRTELKTVRENVVLYRLKRKKNHLLGKDKRAK